MDMQTFVKVLESWRDENIRADRSAPGGCSTARNRAAAYRMTLDLLHDMSDGEFGQALTDQRDAVRHG